MVRCGDYRALLVGPLQPLYAAGCLIANTAPVAFGALGVPILVAGQVTGIDPFHIGAMADVSYRSCRFCAVLAGSNDGRLERVKRMASGAGCWEACHLPLPQLYWSGTADITSALSIVSLALFQSLAAENTETASINSAGAMVVSHLLAVPCLQNIVWGNHSCVVTVFNLTVLVTI